MFPVADVVAESDVEDRVAEVEAVEEEPKCIDYAVALVHDEQHGGRIAAAADASGQGLLGLTATISFAQLLAKTLLCFMRFAFPFALVFCASLFVP